MNCQVENCDSKASHTRNEDLMVDHIDNNGKNKTVQICTIKTLVCELHARALKCSKVTKVILGTI